MFALYRKFFAALIAGAVGIAAKHVPGIEAIVSPAVTDVAAVLAASAAAAFVSNKAGGFKVNDLARIALENLIERPDPAAAQVEADRLVEAANARAGVLIPRAPSPLRNLVKR